ncbi:sensor histidine kinase [Streptomyces subrutilus]|uniref:sensor histidine kinase n=1 Tax=Streptomyces subrutilus TaxID=36818 RepID=UPI002E13DB74|nr:CHASE3 domain-containing protein [Streptomyces subrutilus]
MTAEQVGPASFGTSPTRWSTRGWLGAGTAGFLTLLAVLIALGGWALGHSQAVNTELIDRRSPALIASIRLEGAFLNQETGIRGYGLTGNPVFLEPYTEGTAQERTALDQLRPLLDGDQRAADQLDEVLDRANAWREQYVRPVLDAPPGTTVALAEERAGTGKAAFDGLRASMRAGQEHLSVARADGRADLDVARTVRTWTFAAIITTVLAMTALVFVGLRRGVTRPLGSLSGQVRAVAGGDFGRPITAHGPADLRRLALDVESMRERLARELASSDRARSDLHEQAQELRRSNEELEQFAYVASHDLQEPLRKVASFCQLLQRRYAAELDARANQYIDFAVDGATRMQTLIEDLLSFSRVGRLHNQWQDIALEAVWRQVTAGHSVAIEETSAEISTGPLPTVAGDGTQLTMLFQNLLSNALKFRAPGRTPVIGLTAERDGDRWRFTFTDNGIGIEASFAERVFVIFQRLHTRDAYPGNGIGLAMCKKIVDFHGGAIALDPSHTGGARFTFTLPAAAAADGADSGPAVAGPGGAREPGAAAAGSEGGGSAPPAAERAARPTSRL